MGLAPSDHPTNGHYQTDSISGSSRSYSYDQADRLTAVLSGTTTLGSYSYDGNGLRASKTVSGSSTAFSYDQVGIVPQLIAAGSTSYVDGPGGQLET